MTYCLDIDGVICTNTYGEYYKAVPYKEVIEKVNRLYDRGEKIIFYTSRGETSGRDLKVFTEVQLSKWGVKYHVLKMGKPSADYYIDDRNKDVRFLLQRS